LERYGREEKKEMLKEVRARRKEAHERSRRLLIDMGFTIVEDIGPVSNKPWDFIVKKHGLTYYMDTKNPFSLRGKFTISTREIESMMDLRPNGVPSYLFVLPDGRNIFFTAT